MFKFDLFDEEKVINIYRQTEIVLVKPVLIIFALIYIPWWFLIKFELIDQSIRLLFFWTVLVLIYGIHHYLVWLLNVYIVTDKRVIKVNHKNVFNKQILESPLDRILNISFSVRGFFPALFNFGNVEVQVTGLPAPMLLKNVSHPAKIKDFLWKTYQAHSSKSALQNFEAAHEVVMQNRKQTL